MGWNHQVDSVSNNTESAIYKRDLYYPGKHLRFSGVLGGPEQCSNMLHGTIPEAVGRGKTMAKSHKIMRQYESMRFPAPDVLWYASKFKAEWGDDRP